MSDYPARDAGGVAKENTGIVWYEHPVFGLRVGELASVPVFGLASALRGHHPRARDADHRGVNPQPRHREELAARLLQQPRGQPPSDGATREQLIGRTHRQGQPEDEVTVMVYRHMPAMVEALDKARELAAHIEGTFRAPQKLVRAAYLW